MGSGRSRAALVLGAVVGVLALTPASAGPRSSEDSTPVRVELFTQPGCPHCAAAKAFLDELGRRGPPFELRERDVVADLGARRELEALCADAAIAPCGVPAFRLRGVLVVGFESRDTTGRRLEALVRGSIATEAPGALLLPWLGPLSVERIGLPLFTVALGLLDGFNPCAMWALVFLLSMLIHLRSRARMALIGGVFVGVGGLWYFAFMAAWLHVFLWIGLLRAVQIALGVVAVVFGAVHAKDFVALGRGPSLAIPAAAKPRIYARVRRILAAENLVAALLGAATLSVLVNVVELLCTAGLPALYTQVLSQQDLSTVGRYAYLALYGLAYVADDLLVLGVAVITLGGWKLREREGRWLNLVAGLVMIGLGLGLLLRPKWLGV